MNEEQLTNNESENAAIEPSASQNHKQPASANKPEESFNGVAQTNKTSLFKSKKGILTLSLVGLIIVCIITGIFINKANKEHEYEKNLAQFVMESGKSAMASAYICEDLRSVWSDYIFKDKEYFNSATGQFARSYDTYGGNYVYCADFSEAVNKKIRWNESHLSSTTDEPYQKAKRLYKEMTPAPEKYKDIHVYVKQMFKAMERLHELSTNPTGNLSSYSSNGNQAVEEYTSSLSDLTNESDIDFSKYKSDED